jgi:NAD(P)-dependent dehydrogenase (short-subunit alcohol dehydrogenase family)
MKSALVVGGNSGIGLAIVQRLLAENYDRVYIVGKKNHVSQM